MNDYFINGNGILSLISIVPKKGKQALIGFDGIASWEKNWYKPSCVRVYQITKQWKIRESDMQRAYILLQGANNDN